LPAIIWIGAGATDVRLISGDWNNVLSLQSRLMLVADGGGGSSYISGHAGYIAPVSEKSVTRGNFPRFAHSCCFNPSIREILRQYRND